MWIPVHAERVENAMDPKNEFFHNLWFFLQHILIHWPLSQIEPEITKQWNVLNQI